MCRLTIHWSILIQVLNKVGCDVKRFSLLEDLTVALFISLHADSSIDTTMGGFVAGNLSVCHTISVNENSVVEPDGTIIVRIINSSLIPPNTLLDMAEAKVTVINDDRKLWIPCVRAMGLLLKQGRMNGGGHKGQGSPSLQQAVVY